MRPPFLSLTRNAQHKKRELPNETYIIRKLVSRAVQWCQAFVLIGGFYAVNEGRKVFYYRPDVA